MSANLGFNISANFGDASLNVQVGNCDDSTPNPNPQAPKPNSKTPLLDGPNCVQLRSNGSIRYEGGLVNGVREGSGTKYYPNGEVEYTGGFHANKYEGLNGLQLRADGTKR